MAWRGYGLMLWWPVLIVACQQVAPRTAGEADPGAPRPAPVPAASRPEPAPTPAPATGKITAIGIEELFMKKGEGSVLIVDVRPPFFYRLGHIDGAINLPHKTFPTSYPLKKPDLDAAVAADKTIVLYCANRKCPDGDAIAKSLARRGYSTAVYHGGWDEWKSAGLE